MSAAATVTVSIISHGHAHWIRDLFADFAQYVAPGGRVARIILTLNLAEEAELPPAHWPDPQIPVTILRNPYPIGFGQNHNAASRLCETPFFAALNPDLRLSCDPFSPLVEAMNIDPDLGLLAPRILDLSGQPAPSARALYTPWEIASRLWRDPRDELNPAWLAGMFMLFRTEAFRQIAGFDERFFLYIEDVDICTRLRLAGWQLGFEPLVAVTHAAQHASHRSFRHLSWHLASMIRYWTSPGFRKALAGKLPPAKPRRTAMDVGVSRDHQSG